MTCSHPDGCEGLAAALLVACGPSLQCPTTLCCSFACNMALQLDTTETAGKQKDAFSFHAGCPVLRGTKCV